MNNIKPLQEQTELQKLRIEKLLYLNKDKLKINNPNVWLEKRTDRTFSSIEEELLSQLPLINQDEETEINRKVFQLLKEKGITSKQEFNSEVINDLQNISPELANQIRALEITKSSRLLQLNFNNSTQNLWKLTQNYKFSAEFKQTIERNFGDQTAIAHDCYKYGFAKEYRSMFYHMLRHTTNLTGQESIEEIKELALTAFKGKRILELGSGPGFYLHLLSLFGASVTGIDSYTKLKDIYEIKNAKKYGVNLIFGDAINLESLLKDQMEKDKFDLVFSRNLLTYAVALNSIKPILIEAHKVMKPGAIAIHQTQNFKLEDYYKFLGKVNNICEDTYTTELTKEQERLLIQQNNFNISNKNIENMGYEIIADLKLDAEENKIITLRKPY